ncbi:hypothetical protein [uncultured Roseobacter sp.]|uniref:hypothetical protein n=1 Tax=uncultured Roseobacter sp. TaxID=114847 RepID=UPI00260A4E7E|nr:hypothetical protein [uncultured Roseobacter sp.]
MHSWSIAVSAATLVYEGNSFDRFGLYSYSDEDGRRPYSTSMSVSMTVVLDQRVKANMTNQSFTGQVRAFDGINKVIGTDIRRINLSTDGSKKVIGWDIYVCDGYYCDAFDYNIIRISSRNGDFAAYDYEYSDNAVDDAGHRAFASVPGNMGIAPVPVPGALGLMLSGLVLLGMRCRRS